MFELKKRRDKRIRIYTLIAITTLVITSNFLLVETSQTTTKDNKYYTSEEENIGNSNQINEQKIKHNLANMKGFFTQNQGQLENDEIYFTYSSQDKTFGFSESSVLIKLTKTLDDNTSKSSIIKIIFENSNEVIPIGKKELKHKSNYFIGNDSTKWKSNVLNYEKIFYENLYDGIDLVYYFTEIGLKYDWIVKAYTDPKQIVERFEGIDSLNIDSFGRLIIETGAGELKEEKPYSYQKLMQMPVDVDVNYKIIEKTTLVYDIKDYDSSKDLFIDPLIYSTFIGGTNSDYGGGIALDAEYNVYIVGITNSVDFPTTIGAYDMTYNGGHDWGGDIFLCKLNARGSDLIYSTYIGGNENDWGSSIILDTSNCAYITGSTESPDFPTTFGSYDNTHNGGGAWIHDVIVCKLNQNGSELIYSNFVGGIDNDVGICIELDSENNSYITGITDSGDFPTTPGCYDDIHNGEYDVFVFKLNPFGSDLMYSTFVGGTRNDGYDGVSITLDAENNVYVTGGTESPDFPTTLGSYDNTYNDINANDDCFLFKLRADGSNLVYSSFIGGHDFDVGSGIRVDSEKNTYIIGTTFSINFPTTIGSYDNIPNGLGDFFVLKMNSDGSYLIFSTLIGGINFDEGHAIALDSENNVFIAGQVASSNFPTTTNCYDDSHNGEFDVSLSKLSSDGSSLLYSTFIGGSEEETSNYGRTLRVDNDDNPYITGYTRSSDFPTTTGCYDDSLNGGRDVFVLGFYFKPTAHIDSISPNPASDTDITQFRGHGIPHGKIVRYSWRTNEIELYNGTDSEFYYSNLPAGIYSIYFKVQDDYGIWSDEVSEILIVHEKPVAIIDSISPKPALDTDNIKFKGQGTDDGSIEQYSWKSSIDGEFYNSTDYSFYCNNLSNGKHTINFKVQDNYGVWSDDVSATLIIHEKPVAFIDKIEPNPAIEDELVNFNGKGTDDGIIKTYKWRSVIDGLISSEKSFSLSNLSIGKHTIYFKVKDDYDIWSEEATETLTIKSKEEVGFLPDLTILNSDISFSNNNPKEGEKIFINATIHNIGEIEAVATVEFYVGNPESDGLIINTVTIPIDSKTSEIASIEWKTSIGENEIFVKVTDSNGEEKNISNNIASRKISVEEKNGNDDDFNILWITPPIAIILVIFIGIFAYKKKKEKEEDVGVWCPKCGSEMEFVEDYDDYYCWECWEYLEDME